MKIKHLTRKRGDTDPYQVKIIDANGGPMDITGVSFKLTVNSEESPTDETNQVFQSIGSIIGASADGRVDFPISDSNADNVGNFYYDIEMTSAAGKAKTIQSGQFIMAQDITKSWDWSWLPDGEVDEVCPKDNSEVWSEWAVTVDPLPWTYQVRDSRKVLHIVSSAYHYPSGPLVPWRALLPMTGFEFFALVYHHLSEFSFYVTDIPAVQYVRHTLDSRTGTMAFESFTRYANEDNVWRACAADQIDVTGWGSGWYVFETRIPVAGLPQFRIYPEGSPGAWYNVYFANPAYWLPRRVPLFFWLETRVAVGGFVDLAEFGWRKL